MLTSIHLAYILGTLPLEERFAAARRLGFGAVEFPFPYAVPAEHYAGLLAANDLKQISIGAPAADYKAGRPGFSMHAALKPEFDAALETAIAYAKTIGCDHVHVFAGGLAPDTSADVAFETYCRNLAAAHDRLAEQDLKLVIEPVNATDFPGYFMNRLDFALSACARAERSGIKIILDVYHAHVNNEDPLAFLRQNTQRVAHIQLADFPGRHEPGTGSIDFEAVFRAIRDVDYAGSVGLEYVPTRPVFEGVPLQQDLALPTDSA